MLVASEKPETAKKRSLTIQVLYKDESALTVQKKQNRKSVRISFILKNSYNESACHPSTISLEEKCTFLTKLSVSMQQLRSRLL